MSRAISALRPVEDWRHCRASSFAEQGSTSTNPECVGHIYLSAGRGPQEPQDSQTASEASIAPEPETPALEAPSPACAAPEPASVLLDTFDAEREAVPADTGLLDNPVCAEREAALAELAQISAMSAEAAVEIERLTHGLEDARRGVGSGGLALGVQLRKLREAHHVRANLLPLPLADPIEAKCVRIRGYAATADTDADRSRFSPASWPALDPGNIKLLMSHDPDREVGTIDEIAVDALGRVLITATVTDPFAMRLPALSISASVEKFTIRDPDRPSFVGEIERVGDVNEISLTSTPSNRQCLVFERHVLSPYELSSQELIDRVRRMQKLAAAMMSKAA